MKKIFVGILFIYCGLLLSSQYLLAQNNQPANFSNSSIDIGIVVKDVEKTAKFYSEAIGLKEVQGFNVSKEIAKRFGLTDGDPLNVRVFVLGDAPNSAKLKIMSFPSKQVKKSSQKFINSTLGFSYLTIFVEDMTDSLNRLKKAEVKLLGETPALLPDGIRYITVFKDPDGNYFELIGPMN
tara:strand:- start:10655 stop:11197 length:543 start_codon:yes stop_codon:yes gene_type:complete